MTGLLFDLDGTLLDTLEDLLDATNYALARFGYGPRNLAQLRSVIGNGAANQIRKSLPPETPEEQVQQVLAVYKDYYAAHCQIKTAPYPGIPEALEELAKCHPIAIVSNKPDAAVKALCAEWFPGIFALGEASGCPRKPAPDMVHRAMEAIGAESCVFIGDSEVDILTAANAEVPCLSVSWGFRDEDQLRHAGAKVLCDRPDKLVETIEEMIHGQ